MERFIKLLEANRICVIATCSNNVPRVSAMEYVLVDGSMIMTTDANSIKACNLSKNNKISVSINDMPQFVVIDGTTSKPSKEETDKFNEVLFKRHPEFSEHIEEGIANTATYIKIVPNKVYFSDYTMGIKPAEIIDVSNQSNLK